MELFSAIPLGPDAYAYLKQIAVFFETGHLHYHDLSLIYPILIFITWMTHSPEVALKVFQTGAALFFAVTMAWISFRKYKNILLTLSIGTYCLLSPAIYFVNIQFPKQFLAIIFFILFLFSFNHEKLKKISLGWAIATIITHRLTAGLIFIGGIYYFFKARLIKLKKYQLFLGGLVFLILLQLFPGAIHISDIGRFKNLFASQLNLPLIFFPFTYWHKSFVLMMDQIFLLTLLIFVAVQKIKQRQPLFLFLTFFLLFPFFNLNVLEPIYRLYLTLLLLIPFLLVMEVKNTAGALKLILGWSVLLIFLFAFHYESRVFDPPYRKYENLTQKIQPLLQKHKPDLLIVHKPFNEVISYRLKHDAMAWLPEYSATNVLRISFGITQNEFKYYLKEKTAQIIMLDQSYALLPEILWQDFVQRVVKANDQDLLFWIHSDQNPYKIRPQYLQRLKIKPHS